MSDEANPQSRACSDRHSEAQSRVPKLGRLSVLAAQPEGIPPSNRRRKAISETTLKRGPVASENTDGGGCVADAPVRGLTWQMKAGLEDCHA